MRIDFLQFSVLAVMCGAVISVMPDGGVKHISQILSTIILVAGILSLIGDFSFREYAFESFSAMHTEDVFSNEVEEKEEALKQVLIEQQCREYILDKAYDNGVSVCALKIEFLSSESDDYFPYRLEILGEWDISEKNALKEIIQKDLGIPEERQYWEHER